MAKTCIFLFAKTTFSEVGGGETLESTKIKQGYEDGKAYFKQMGFMDKWPLCERFKAGDQWPAPTAKTKNLPRPVINIIRYIENHKVSAILNEPVKMVFAPDELDEEDLQSQVAANVFSQYSATEWENTEQDKLNEKALDNASNLGTAIWHYYWDSNYTGGRKLAYVGRLAGEIIDPINCFVGNPQQQDTQKQPYIIISYRDTVENARQEAKANGANAEQLSLIVGDKDTRNEGYDSAQKEIKDKVTVLTCYWKENGTVWLMKICGDVIVKPEYNTQHKLYPIVSMSWYERDKSWYGVGDTEGLINNQKAINFMVAMQMMSAQLTGMPKLMIKEGYVDNILNNDPAAVIHDKNTTGGTWSAQYLQPSSMTPQVNELVEFLMTNSKTLSGATETATGELAKSSQMNATAIMLLQKASGVPIESIKRRFRRAMEETGNIELEFWTINYNTARYIPFKDDEGNETSIEFRGSDFKDIGLKLKIDIGVSTDYSETLVMTTLDKLYDKGAIDTQTYVELAPQSVVPFKEDLLKKLAQQQIMQQEQQNAMMQQVMQQQNNTQLPQTPQM